MSTHFEDIYKALETHLDALSQPLPIQWPNNPLKEEAKEYLKVDHLPGGFTQMSLGSLARDQAEGIFQVLLLRQKGEGGSTIPDLIADHFKRGTYLSNNDIVVRVKSASINTAFTRDSFFISPVSIRYDIYSSPRVSA